MIDPSERAAEQPEDSEVNSAIEGDAVSPSDQSADGDTSQPAPEEAQASSPSEPASTEEEPSTEDVPATKEEAAEDTTSESGEPTDEPVAAAAKPPAKKKAGKKRGPIEETPDVEEDEDVPKDWYILKVASNREKSICANLLRKVKKEGMEKYFGEVLVPTEDLVEYKNGKKRVTKQKLYPGYIVVYMAINDDTWFLVRETGGIGDFTGSGGKPSPMPSQEIERILKKTLPDEDVGEKKDDIKTNIRFKIGEHVRITEGTFENFEGDVEGIDETNGRVTVMINIFGRTTPVEMEHWRMEPV
ncbi:MAG: transcription termination/antitermination protein NusG [Pirellulaceae bacterium]